MAARSMMANGQPQSAIDAMEIAARAPNASIDWFGSEEFYPLYRDPRWVALVASVAGDDETAIFMNQAEARRKAAEASGTRVADIDIQEDLAEPETKADATREPAQRSAPAFETAAAAPKDSLPPPTRSVPPTLPRTNEPKVHRLEVDNDGLVTDLQTSLMWGRPTETPYWKDAEDYVNGFGKAGHIDWRMPSLTELRDICGAVNEDSGDERLPRFIWSSDRRGPPIPRARKAGLYDCRDNDLEGFYTINEIKTLLEERRGMAIYAIAIRNAD